MVDIGRMDEFLAVTDLPPNSTWMRAAEMLARGHLVEAAEAFAAIGMRFGEAWVRLIAAERGDLSQLEPSRAFFAAERAAPFLRRCEAVLAASA